MRTRGSKQQQPQRPQLQLTGKEAELEKLIEAAMGEAEEEEEEEDDEEEEEMEMEEEEEQEPPSRALSPKLLRFLTQGSHFFDACWEWPTRILIIFDIWDGTVPVPYNFIWSKNAKF